MLNHQPNRIEWRADTPFSTKFDDPYYSLDDGLAETEHVFLAGNNLPDRYCDGFHIAELGFGTGLNLLVSLAAWRRSGQSGVLHYTSFEAFPLSPDQMTTAHKAFAPLQDLAAELAPLWGNRITLHDLRFEVILGDARDTLPKWSGQADAWFLDGFSPAKNPELWEANLMAEVATHTKTGGSCATYTAAGFVRRGLQAGGFEVIRCTRFWTQKAYDPGD